MGSHQKERNFYKLNLLSMAISLAFHGVIVGFFIFGAIKGSSAIRSKNHLGIALTFMPNKTHHSEQIIAKNDVLKQEQKISSSPPRPKRSQSHESTRTQGRKNEEAPSEVDAHESTSLSGEKGHQTTRLRPFLLNGKEVKIPYPEQARARRIEGTVVMKLTVAETGKVIDVDIISGPAYGLRQAALMVARKLFFLPATDQSGNARVAQIEHEVIFRLKS